MQRRLVTMYPKFAGHKTRQCRCCVSCVLALGKSQSDRFFHRLLYSAEGKAANNLGVSSHIPTFCLNAITDLACVLAFAATHDTSTILSPAFRAAESCLWSAEIKMSGLTASAQAI